MARSRNRNIEVPPNLSSEELKTLFNASRDVFFFSTFAKVVNPVRGVVNFDLYPYQKSVLYQLDRKSVV